MVFVKRLCIKNNLRYDSPALSLVLFKKRGILMKKIISITSLFAASILSGCASTNTPTSADTINTSVDIGKTVFQTAVNNKCLSELTNNKVWKTAQVALTQNQKEQIKYRVCGCVSTKAVQDVTIEQLSAAVIDRNSRNALVANSVVNSLNTCVMNSINK